MQQPITLHSEDAYEIAVRGDLDPSWQAGLVGLIRRLHGLGPVILQLQLR